MDSIPASNLSKIYPSDQHERYSNLQSQFQKIYNESATLIVRSPGRVNLIGDHIDYSQFSVLPMAVESDIVLAVSTHEPELVERSASISLPAGSALSAGGHDVASGRSASVSVSRLGGAPSAGRSGDTVFKAARSTPYSASHPVVSAHFSLTNQDPQFASSHFSLHHDEVVIDASVSDWANYFKCGLKVAHQYMLNHDTTFSGLKGMNILVNGTVPTAIGLSSSAAFVVASTLAALLANGFPREKITKKLLTSLSITCEQHLGVNSGGMDQAASIYGQKGKALFISFYPELSVEPFSFEDEDRGQEDNQETSRIAHIANISLESSQTSSTDDSSFVFIIANSMVSSKKYDTAPIYYNLRVVEVTLAANILAKKLKLSLKPDGNLSKGTLRGVLESYFLKRKDILDFNSVPQTHVFGQDKSIDFKYSIKQLRLLEEQANWHLTDDFTTEDVASALDISVAELQRDFMTTFPVRYEVLKLRSRAIHVFAESRRVLEFISLLNSRPLNPLDLGSLMIESHFSSVRNYECSTPQIDQLCRIAIDNGALGSRVTGAGWGGSTVHLVRSTDVDNVLQALKDEYYKRQFPGISPSMIDVNLLVARPGTGTAVVNLESI